MKETVKYLVVICLAVFATITISSCGKKGCTDEDAENFDSAAKRDDGTCVVKGCMDMDATNFMDNATEDDASCVYTKEYYLTHESWEYAYGTRSDAGTNSYYVNYTFKFNKDGTAQVTPPSYTPATRSWTTSDYTSLTFDGSEVWSVINLSADSLHLKRTVTGVDHKIYFGH